MYITQKPPNINPRVTWPIEHGTGLRTEGKSNETETKKHVVMNKKAKVKIQLIITHPSHVYIYIYMFPYGDTPKMDGFQWIENPT